MLTALVSGWLFLASPTATYADEPTPEQVVVSPAQQAVNTALATATTEVQQAAAATDTATATIATAQTEITQAQAAVAEIQPAITAAQSAISAVDTATATITNINQSTNLTDQSSQTVQSALTAVDTATASVATVATEISQAQTEISQAAAARTDAATAQSTAQTELTQANIAIDNAQTAVNALQATIGTTTDVLQNVDDAGVRMNLPFNMLMGGTLYSNVYVGSNATITFGVNEGSNYYSTPNAPSVSIAGWDWTTWSTGTGITYSTTASTLDIAWDVRPYPQMDASTQMVQVRFNADVNPSNGAWAANVSATGPIPNGARFNYRQTTGGAVTQITDTNPGAGFSGQISQGPAFTPIVDSSTATVQAAIDSANATIATLNASLTPVVNQNATNNSNISSMASTITSLTNTTNTAVTTKNNLQTQVQASSEALNTAIQNNIPTPAPVLAQPIVDGTTITVTPTLPQGYTPNTWFYQVSTDDANAANPYANQTLNTSGAPENIVLSGLTQGATYTIRVANWSGPTSQYTSTTVQIPAPTPPPAPAPAPAPEPPQRPVVIVIPADLTPPVTDTPSDQSTTPSDTTTDPVQDNSSSTETPSDNQDTTGTTDSTDQTNSDTTNTDSSNQDNSSSNDTNDSSQQEAPVDNSTDNTQTQPDVTPEPTPQPDSQDNSTPESTPGLVENNPNSLPESEPKLPDPSQLVAKVQVDKPGVENGGIEFFGTKSQPQVIGEDGKLTPPPPPPGSGLPIPEGAITTTETFIGQPGGTTFNAPDIAVPVQLTYVCTTIKKDDGTEVHLDLDGNEHTIEQCTFLPDALNAIPGAGEAIQALGALYTNMANIGNDMSPITRQKSKKILVTTVILTQIAAIRRRFGQ